MALAASISLLIYGTSRIPNRTTPGIEGSMKGICVVFTIISIFGWISIRMPIINNKVKKNNHNIL